jgi:hypothetical protein
MFKVWRVSCANGALVSEARWRHEKEAVGYQQRRAFLGSIAMNWSERWFRSNRSGCSGGAKAHRSPRAHLSVEGLEDRAVPAVIPSPGALQTAYGIDRIRFGDSNIVGNGAGQTIALVVIGADDASIVSDLKEFDLGPFGPQQSGLLNTFGSYDVPHPGSTKPWFAALTDPNFPPATNYTPAEISRHNLETAEDVEWAHGIATMANILLVETGSIQSGTGYAGTLQMQNPTWGISVIASSSSHFPTFHPEDYADSNVAYVGITGDTGTSINSQLEGFGLQDFPASTPDVIAVGGSTLTLNPDHSYGSETAWGFAPPNRFLTSGDATYSLPALWSPVSGGFSGTVDISSAGGASFTSALWTTTVLPSDTLGLNDHGLEISATWVPNTGFGVNADNAQYVIINATTNTIVDTVTVNQRLAPTGTTGTQNGRTATFQELCALTGVHVGDTIQVELKGGSDGLMVADAIGLGPDDASGGGLSDEPQPSFQAGLVIHNGNSTISSGGHRAYPDVAFDGDYVNSPVIIVNQGMVQQVAGTSLGAPAWAGLITIADQGLATVGHAPLSTAQVLAGLYSIPSSDFHDETTGYNGYSAGFGYDLVTGLGSPIANLLILDLDRTVAPVSAPHFFVIPVSQLEDTTHFHTLADAMTAAVSASSGMVTIEPGASPDPTEPVNVSLNESGLTIQGDPSVPASILPQEQLVVDGSAITLSNLNLGSLSMEGDSSADSVSKCLIGSLSELARNSSFTQNTITGSAVVQPIVLLFPSTGNVVIANNTFSSAAVNVLQITSCTGVTVTGNTFFGGSGSRIIQVTDAGSRTGPITIANNSITASGSLTVAINVNQDTSGIAFVKILNNVLNTNNTGDGVLLETSTGDAMHFNILVQGNDFHNNAIAVAIGGDGTSVGNVDLGGGTLGSLGGNDFRVPQRTFAVFISRGNSATVPVAQNIFTSGVSPATVLTGATFTFVDQTLSDARAFVQTLYNNLLGRTGALAELDGWVQLLSTQGQAAVANAILHSSEALGRIVDSFYLRFLGRQSDAVGRAGWIGFLQHGGTEEQLEALFLTSPEYISHIDTDFVQSLYLNILGRSGSPAELAQWNNILQNVGGLSGVASAFVNSPESRLNSLRSDFQMSLHRTPSDTELTPLVVSSLDLLSLDGLILSSPEFFMNG